MLDHLPNAQGAAGQREAMPVALFSSSSRIADVAHDFTTVNHTSSELPAIAGRPAYLELTGAGSGVFQIEYECADGTAF